MEPPLSAPLLSLKGALGPEAKELGRDGTSPIERVCDGGQAISGAHRFLQGANLGRCASSFRALLCVLPNGFVRVCVRWWQWEGAPPWELSRRKEQEGEDRLRCEQSPESTQLWLSAPGSLPYRSAPTGRPNLLQLHLEKQKVEAIL